MQDALDRLWPYTGEMFAGDAVDDTLAAAGIAPDPESLRAPWSATVDRVQGSLEGGTPCVSIDLIPSRSSPASASAS